MVRGLYTAASGAIVAQANVDVIANNLANVNTSGFKRSLMQVEAGEKTTIYRDQIDPGNSGELMRGVAAHALVGQLGFGSQIYDTPTVFDQGAIQQTGNPLDVALSGSGFLAVSDAAGTTSSVRGGSFVQTAQGLPHPGKHGDLIRARQILHLLDQRPITVKKHSAVQIQALIIESNASELKWKRRSAP